jgi:hypothetical protein
MHFARCDSVRITNGGQAIAKANTKRGKYKVDTTRFGEGQANIQDAAKGVECWRDKRW